MMSSWLETGGSCKLKMNALGTFIVYESCVLESPHLQPFQNPKEICRDLLLKVITAVVANQSLP